MTRGAALVVLLAVTACGHAAPFRLEAERGSPVSRFRLIAAPGARLNARLKPALELENGTILRFDSPHVTPDTAYFLDAPTIGAPIGADAHHGIVRASVCPAGGKICRSFSLAVRL